MSHEDNRKEMDQVEWHLRKAQRGILACDDVWKSDERGQIMANISKALHLAEKWNKRFKDWQKPYSSGGTL